MTAKQQHEYAPDDELVQKALELGSKLKIAQHFGYPDSTFKHHVANNPELKVRIDEAIKQCRKNRSKNDRTRAQTAAASEQVTREEILDQRNAELEKLVREHRQAQVFDERVILGFTEAFGRVKPRYNPNVIRRRKSDDEGHEHILLFSDAHANEVVSQEETMGLNAFDWNILLRRMARIQKAVHSFQEHRSYPISKLNIFMLGDNLSGDIHDELTETNEMPNEESVVQFSLDTVRWLEGFTEHYSKIGVAGVPGNHPRKSRKPTAKMAFNNSDWTYYQFLKARLEGHEQFEFQFQKAKFLEVTVAKRWRTLLLHGDGVRSTMVDVPWGGIIRYLGKLSRQFAAAGRPIDLFTLGHYHTANALEAGGPGVKTFVNASLKGLDEYSLQRFGGGGPPAQLLLTVHPRKGVTDVSYLDCEDVLPQHERFRAAA